MNFIIAGNPFVDAYAQSDWLGKAIFLGLFILSILCWTVLIHKGWILFKVRKLAIEFTSLFSEKDPLNLQFVRSTKDQWIEVPHPFFEIYKTFKQNVLKIINRNHFFSPGAETYLSEADLGLLESQVYGQIASQSKVLEKNLFVLSTVVTLAPFLGLLGTVWGILLTFSQLHAKGLSLSNASMLSGLALALATTVVGLIVAIPALVGHNYLKNGNKEFKRDMEDFTSLLMASLELQYRKPEHASKTTSLSR